MHPFHTGRDDRYSGAATIPRTASAPIPAAALVLHHPKLKVQIDPMYRTLDVCPGQQSVESVRLVPITAIDFYPSRHALPDLHQLGHEADPTGDPKAANGDLRARTEVRVPAARGDVREIQGSSAGRGGSARGMEGAT